MNKKKGGRYTPPKQSPCPRRSAHAHKPLPHKFTSRHRTKVDGEWAEWVTICSWCMTKEKRDVQRVR